MAIVRACHKKKQVFGDTCKDRHDPPSLGCQRARVYNGWERETFLYRVSEAGSIALTLSPANIIWRPTPNAVVAHCGPEGVFSILPWGFIFSGWWQGTPRLTQADMATQAAPC